MAQISKTARSDLMRSEILNQFIMHQSIIFLTILTSSDCIKSGLLFSSMLAIVFSNNFITNSSDCDLLLPLSLLTFLSKFSNAIFSLDSFTSSYRDEEFVTDRSALAPVYVLTGIAMGSSFIQPLMGEELNCSQTLQDMSSGN